MPTLGAAKPDEDRSDQRPLHEVVLQELHGSAQRPQVAAERVVRRVVRVVVVGERFAGGQQDRLRSGRRRTRCGRGSPTRLGSGAG